MKLYIPAIFLSLIVLQGCHSQPGESAESVATNSLPPPVLAPGGEDEVIATIRGDVITRKDLEPVLIEGYGLKVLLALVQLDLVKQEAATQHIIVTPQDVAAERGIMMDNLRQATQEMDASGQPTTQPDTLSSDQEEQLLDLSLQQQHVSMAEFNVVLQVDAYLRKIAGPKVDANITENAIRRQFNAMYGEKVVVHYIVCNNMSEVAEVRRALALGQSFEDVARLRSRDRRTGATGGELPPFTLSDNRFPDEFKQVAFNLKIGEVSDPVQIERFIYIAKLIDRIPPALARYEDYRDSVKKQLYDSMVQAAMKAMLDRLGSMALASLRVRDPVLDQQWEEKLSNKSSQIKDNAQIRQELDKEHAAAQTSAEPPATRPATAP